MTRLFIIMERDEYNDTVHHQFVMESQAKAISAFRTLYGEQPQYVLFEQVAVSEPTGSCDEADDATMQDSVQQKRLEQRVANLHRE